MSTEKHNYTGGFCSFEEVWERIQAKTNIKSYTQLAKLIGKTQQNVSTYKNRNQFPYGWAFPVAQKYRLSTDWILTGEEPRARDESSSLKSLFIRNIDQWLKEESFNDQDFSGYFRFTFKKNFPAFEEWLKRRDSKEGESDISSSSKVA